MKKYFFFLIMVAYSFLSLPAYSQSTESFEFTNPYHGFSITYPTTWFCSINISEIFGITTTNKAESKINFKDSKSVSVIIGYHVRELSENNYTDYFEGVSRKRTDYQFISKRLLKIDGKDFHSISYSYTEGLNKFYTSEYVIITGNKMIIIISNEISPSPENQKVISDIVFSFKETDGYLDHRKALSDSLVMACWKGDYTKSLLLLSQGALVNDVNKNGLSPLHAASSTPNYELFSHLLSIGADPNLIYGPNRTTPIFWVNWNLNNRGKINFYQLLIDKGADLTVKNQNDKTIYQVLKEQVYLKDDAKYLKSRGAK